MTLSRRSMLLAAGATLLAGAGGLAVWPGVASGRTLQVHRSPSCGCCGAWMAYMSRHGYRIEELRSDNLTPIKQRLGVPPSLASCHTAVVEGYVIEGHVPVQDVERLLAERPRATGIAVPGMPIGSPGMEQGDRRDRYSVILFGADGESLFARH